MIITLTGKTTGIVVRFMNDQEFRRQYGYGKMLPNCYDCNTNQTATFRMSNMVGLYDNLPVESYSDIGAGESGNVWRGNYLGSRLIGWNFKNVFGRGQDNLVSPNELLTAMINEPFEIVEVKVQTDEEYTLDFHFTPDTSVEAGVIGLESVDSNNGTLWSKGAQTLIWYLFEQSPTIPFKLNQVLLQDTNYPFNTQVYSATVQNPKITIGGEVNGYWDSFQLTFNGEVYYYDNVDNDDFIIIDSENLTVENESGEDRTSNLSFPSSGLYPVINTGINNVILTIDGLVDYKDLFIHIPTDIQFKIEYQNLTSAISGGIEC